MSGVTTASGPGPSVRVLALARDPHDLPARPPWDPDDAGPLSLSAAVGVAPSRAFPYEVRLVRAEPATGLRARGRAALVGAKTGAQALRAGAPAPWMWRLKRSAWLRREIGRTDVVWSVDADTDAVLRALPELAQGRPVLESTRAPQVWAALADVVTVVHELAELDQRPTPVEPAELAERWARWRALVSSVDTVGVPGVMLPVEALAAVGHRLGASVGSRAAPEVLATVLDLPVLPERERGLSGLAAQRAAADLRTARDPGDRPDEAVLAAAADLALEGADAALAAGDGLLALARLSDAMRVLFHRERHAEVPFSPLVADPGDFLRSLVSSATLRELVSPETVRAKPRAADGRPPRVLVVTGSYGSFHQGVVDALEGWADLRTVDVADRYKLLSRKGMDVEVLVRLASLVAAERGHRLPGVPDPTDEDARAVAALSKLLRWTDVVFTDWVDRSTVWVSHLCLPRVRLVVRVHSLDTLDPWMHLVNWGAVDEVVVVSEPLRSFVEDLLAGHGAQVPVKVLPNLVGLGEMPDDKDESARTTLGMIGWGRRVKDPLWAFDLLSRDPSWHLVLIGADFPQDPPERMAGYVAELRRRMSTPALRDRVHVVGPVDDVRQPLRRVGVILSTSLRESWHVGLVEGAASGAVPVVRNWPLFAARGGPRTLFPDDWVVDDLDQAEARVREVTDPARWEQERQRARTTALQLFDPEDAARRYRELVLGDYLTASPPDPVSTGDSDGAVTKS